jgi:hypothetical protein
VNVPHALKPLFQKVNLPAVSDPPIHRRVETFNRSFHFTATSGPGVLLIHNIEREKPGVPVSQVAQAFYERDFAQHELRYIFMDSVVNEETRPFIIKGLYPMHPELSSAWRSGSAAASTSRSGALPTESEETLAYIYRTLNTDRPQYDNEITWEYATAEYDAILGTRIGKVVSYIVLGAFARGTRRIRRIVTWPAGGEQAVFLRFDIEPLSTHTYGELQDAGARIRRWIDDPTEPGCHVSPSSLSFEQVRQEATLQTTRRNVPLEFLVPFDDLIHLTDEWRNPVALGMSVYHDIHVVNTTTDLRAWIGPRVVLLANMRNASRDMRMSEIIQVMYQHFFNLSSLHYMFLQDVVNRQTRDLVTSKLYHNHGANWPNWEGGQWYYAPMTWEYDTPEYDALMGTSLGRTIGYLILGAFPRGTRRILRILTWPDSGTGLNMRFDIGDIDGSTKGLDEKDGAGNQDDWASLYGSDSSSISDDIGPSEGKGKGRHIENAPEHRTPARGASSKPNLKYGKLQGRGAQMRRWMEFSEQPGCSIEQSALTLHELRFRSTEMTPVCIPQTFASLDLEHPGDPAELSYRMVDHADDELIFKATVGPGIILLHEFLRVSGPQIPKVIQAFYQGFFPLYDLKYLFVANVSEEMTQQFIIEELYPSNGLEWPSSYTWDAKLPTPEFDALLGTPVCELISKFVLGAFPRGTRRISRIVTFYESEEAELNLSFEIASILAVTGAQIRRWIGNPNEANCKVAGCTMTWDNSAIGAYANKHSSVTEASLDLKYTYRFADVGLPTHAPTLPYHYVDLFHNFTKFKAMVGPGVIWIADITRNRDGPPISEVSLAFYKKHFSQDIRHVFVDGVINAKTKGLIIGELYPWAGVEWPTDHSDNHPPTKWKFDTPGYDAILGSPIGRLVAFIVLGGFPRGSHRIRKIVIWPNTTMQEAAFDMRFDIEKYVQFF